MNEFELIKQYFNQRPATGAGVVLGIGDDCALLQPPAGEQLAVSIDTIVADVHFPAEADAALVGERALRVALSDLAAMGAKPLWFTLALTMPETSPAWLKGFSSGLMNAAGLYRCALIGGDTTRGPLAVTVQVHGSLMPGRALRRDGAKVGDLVFVTGTLGDAAAALAVIKKELEVGGAASAYFLDRFYRPRPQIKTGQQLVGVASAAIDVSDGLLADLGHICTASGIGADVDVDKLPLSSALAAKASLDQCHAWALAGGDDYQLCFTVPPLKSAQIQGWIANGSLDATCIGKVTKTAGVRCWRQGQRYTPAVEGYQHFASY